MVIVDFSHLSFRMLHTSISIAKPKKKNSQYITSDFENVYKHLVFQSLLYLKKTFNSKDIIITFDTKGNWRKDFYPDYKANRKKGREESEINFDEFFKVLDDIKENLKHFPFKLVELEKLEADDIAGILVKEFPEKEKVLVTSDKDWKQNLIHKNTKMYDPVKREYVKISQEEKELLNIKNVFESQEDIIKSKFSLKHALIGDAGDNVPGVTRETVFSDSFKKYLKEKNLDIEPKDFHNLSQELKDELIDNFDVFKIIKAGKRKGEYSDEKDVWKMVPFGEKKALKVIENENTLLEFLKSKPMYLDNFKRNIVLVSLDYIPKEFYTQVKYYIENYKIDYNSNEIKDYFIKNSLNEMFSNCSQFFDERYENNSTLSFDTSKSYNVENPDLNDLSNSNDVELKSTEFDW